MPKIEQKQVVIDEIKEKVSKAKSIVLVDGRGLTVAGHGSQKKTQRSEC